MSAILLAHLLFGLVEKKHGVMTPWNTQDDAQIRSSPEIKLGERTADLLKAL